jgi:hypothetical protein
MPKLISHRPPPTLPCAPTNRRSQIYSAGLSILLTAISKFDAFSSYHIVRTRIAKVANFFPFSTIGISMYQKRILPYFVIPSTFSPQTSSPLERHGQKDREHSSPPVT